MKTMENRKKARISMADLARNPAIVRDNPHLFGIVDRVAPPLAPKPIEKAVKLSRSPKPRTKPEKHMDLMLAAQLRRGEFSQYAFEGIRLQVGDGSTYTPDFTVWEHDGTLRFVEVKGPYAREDGVTKYKCAKGKYGLAKWEFWQLLKTGWTRTG